MSRRSSRFSLAFSALVALGSNALASNQYVLDDGIPNSGLSYGIPADYGWLQSFTTVGASDAISKVSIQWQPGGVPVGTVVRVCVWEDPNNDGNPYDAILVGQATGLVPNVTALTYTDYAISSLAVVHGGFFLGAYLTTDGSFGSISLLDYNSPYSHRAWFAVNSPSMFDAIDMGNNNPNHIEILGAGIHGVFLLRAEGTGSNPEVYCVAKTNSLGCTPRISTIGIPSASASSGFFVQASSVLNRKGGMLIYGTHGRAATPYLGGTLCVAAPLRRTVQQSSGGSAAGNDCTGAYSFDFTAWMHAGNDPLLLPGTTVNAQYYSRDPGFPMPNSIGLTDAVEFTLVP